MVKLAQSTLPMTTARLLFLLIAAAFTAPIFAAPQAGDTVVRQGTFKEDLYLAGGTVDVLATVEGDVLAAGGQVNVDNQVSGDVMVAGGNVAVRARVGDDVRIVGGNVTVAANIGDDLVAAGGQVLLSPAAVVGGRAWLTGNTITLSGKVGKDLVAAGRRIVISGRIAGNVELYAEEIEIQRGALIEGNLTYRSRDDAFIAKDAKIVGTLRREALPADQARGTGITGGIARGALSIGLVLAGIVLYLLFPIASVGAARQIGDSPWKSLGLGFAFLAATPVVVVLLFATLFGVWLALLTLPLYLVGLFVGFLIGVLYIGEVIVEILGRRAQITTVARVLAIVAAFLVLWAVRFAPVLGGVVVFALTVFGTGALTLYLARRYAAEA